MTDRKALVDSSEPPEDVATLYSWANLHGAKYRDFSASRAQTREKARQRVQDAIRGGVRNPGSLDYFFKGQRFGRRSETIEKLDGSRDNRNPVFVYLTRHFLSVGFGFHRSTCRFTVAILALNSCILKSVQMGTTLHRSVKNVASSWLRRAK